jgi:hypothetical protein
MSQCNVPSELDELRDVNAKDALVVDGLDVIGGRDGDCHDLAR